MHRVNYLVKSFTRFIARSPACPKPQQLSYESRGPREVHAETDESSLFDRDSGPATTHQYAVAGDNDVDEVERLIKIAGPLI